MVKIDGDSADPEAKKQSNPRLAWALTKAFWPWILNFCILELIFDFTRFIPPLLLDLIIKFIAHDDYPWRGFLYCFSMLVCDFGNNFLYNACMFYVSTSAMQFKSTLVSAIYRKSLRISSSTRRNYTTGELVNLIAVDVDRVFQFIMWARLLYAIPLRIIFTIALLWQYLGISCLAGIAVLLGITPQIIYIAKKIHALQEKQMKSKDSRLKDTNEILNGIKVLKLCAWEVPFMKKISGIRNIEVKLIRTYLFCYAVSSLVWGCASIFFAIASFVTYVLISKANALHPSTVFVSLNLLNMLRNSLCILPNLILNLVQINISLRRLRTFLTAEEYEWSSIGNNPNNCDAITIREAALSWGVVDGQPTLVDINLSIPKGALVAVIGQVGSGKSSFLSSILGEMHKLSGSIDLKGKLAYVPQQAWIQNQTVRQNILFGKSMDKKMYNLALDMCCLIPDLNIFPGGDLTEIGEKGINISGGQKQRISLARAVFQDADIYLLDDPLSAVDAHVGKYIFENVIGKNGLLKEKTRILVTHSISVLPYVDIIVTMKGGRIEEIGSYEKLINQNGPFSEFYQKHLNVQESSEPEDKMVNCDVLTQSDSQELRNRKRLSDQSQGIIPNTSVLSESISSKHGAKLMEDEKMEIGEVKRSVYLNYMRHASLRIIVPAIFMYFGYQAFEVGANIWLSHWTMDPLLPNGTQNVGLRNVRIMVYAALCLCQVLLLLFGNGLLAIGGTRASRVYHEQMLESIMKSPMSFFDTTPLGRIINRFSIDMDVVDVQIPKLLDWYLMCLCYAVGTFIVVGMNTPLFYAVAIPLGIVFYLIQKLYLITSRQMKRLDSTTKSPILSHFTESLQGVSSIKAYDVQNEFIKTAEEKMDTNISCFFYWCACNRWLTFWLDLVGSIIILTASLLAVFNRHDLPGAVVGLSLTYALTVASALTFMVRHGTELENMTVSVERIDEYSNLPSEAPWQIEESHPPESWPSSGTVQFKKYSTKYRKDLDLVLKEINLEISSNEKIGIVGRTGAGKSSVTLGLFRMIEPVEGTISIDGVDVSKIGLHNLRSELTIIPQDPVLFSGSLRLNLDPNDEYTDEELWTSLEHAHLKTFIASLTKGLNHDIAEGGGNLSFGQKQLICLARALLKKSKILILDEVTAAVDVETDQLIQNTIRTAFKEYTVITIAHRLNTILDYDRVVVMAEGQIMEIGNPLELLQQPDSKFYVMAKDAGII